MLEEFIAVMIIGLVIALLLWAMWEIFG